MPISLDEFLKRNARERDRKAFKSLLASEDGRWLLSKIGFENYVHTSTFTGNAETYKREGSRQVALKMFDEIRLLGKDAIIDLLKAEGERHIWIQEQTNIYHKNFKKEKGEHIHAE